MNCALNQLWVKETIRKISSVFKQWQRDIILINLFVTSVENQFKGKTEYIFFQSRTFSPMWFFFQPWKMYLVNYSPSSIILKCIINQIHFRFWHTIQHGINFIKLDFSSLPKFMLTIMWIFLPIILHLQHEKLISWHFKAIF